MRLDIWQHEMHLVLCEGICAPERIEHPRYVRACFRLNSGGEVIGDSDPGTQRLHPGGKVRNDAQHIRIPV